jgi:outer membrane protein OmpA-like peptidoglycan-associated protein
MKRNLLLLLIACFAFPAYGQHKDTFEVYFPFNNSKITKEAEDYIDRLIFNDTLIHGDKLMVLGYADYVGGNKHNDSLSVMRANTVRNYLIKYGFDKEDISLCVGKGKIDRKNIAEKNGYAPDRKVQIVIVHAPTVRSSTPPPAAKSKPKIDISQLKVNQAFALNNLFFEPGMDFLLPESAPDLAILLGFLRDNPTVTVRIEGHICCLGSQDGHDARYKDGYLSAYRAKAIYNYLVKNGIDTYRMKTIGLGNNDPVVKNEVTEDDRRKNRRVEIRIMSK